MQDPNDPDPDCLFCRWIRDGVETVRHGTVAAFKDGFPVAEGHLLMCPCGIPPTGSP